VTKPKVETLVNAILRNRKRVFSIIAARLLDIVPEGHLTSEQLEFVISNIGEAAIPFVPRLYREMKRVGLMLEGALQRTWEESWRFRGELGPAGYCPKCGFRSVDPTGTCMVCGYALNDKELRESTDFDSKFVEFLNNASCEELKNALKEGKAFVDHLQVTLNPSSKWAIEIFLTRNDRKRIENSLISKCNIEKMKDRKLEKVLDDILSKL
jgi:hypothetical protein